MTENATKFDTYLEAWRQHGNGDSEVRDRFLDQTTPDYFYEDIHNPDPFTGTEGITIMWTVLGDFFQEVTFDVSHVIVTDTGFSYEWIAKGIHRASGNAFDFRGVSVGDLTADGLVSRHVDYWSMGQMEAQVGSLG